METTYDIAVIGAGPAGMAAAIYTSRANLKTIIFEKGMPGGQIALTSSVENYPGFPEEISGADLAMKFQRQAQQFGAEFSTDEIISINKPIDRPDNLFELKSTHGKYTGKTVIIASGSKPTALGIPGEKKFMGKGVSTCSTCDGALFKDKKVFVIGGGDTAIDESLFLTKFVSSLIVVHRRDKLKASPYLSEKAFKNKKISFIWNTIPVEIKGTEKIEKFVLKNKKTGELSEHAADGIFVFIGHKPNTVFLKDILKLDDTGHIIVDKDMKTRMEGIFAAGDVRSGSMKQISTSAGDGVCAALSAQKYLEA